MVSNAGSGDGYTGALAVTLSSTELLILDLLVVVAVGMFAIAAGLTAPHRDQPGLRQVPPKTYQES